MSLQLSGNWSLLIVMILILAQSVPTLLGAVGVNLGWLHLNRALLSSSGSVRHSALSVVGDSVGVSTATSRQASAHTPRSTPHGSETRERELQHAARWLQWSLNWQPQNVSAHENLADLYLLAGDWKAAEKELVMATELAPEEVSIHFRLGNARYIQGQEEEALEEWRAAGALPYFLRLGEERMEQEDWEGAEASFQLAIKVAPDRPEPRYLLGNLYALQGRKAEAIAIYEEGVFLEPSSSAEWLARRAQIHAWKEEWTLALKTYRAALEQAPHEARYAYRIGQVLEEGLGDRIQAQSWYAYAIQLDAADSVGNCVSPYLALARLAQENGHCEEALAWLEQARSVDAEALEAAELHYRVGRCEQNQGRPRAALFHLKQAVHLEGKSVRPPRSATYRLALAQVYVELGHFQKAIQQYREVLEMDPDNRRARQGLEELWAGP